MVVVVSFVVLLLSPLSHFSSSLGVRAEGVSEAVENCEIEGKVQVSEAAQFGLWRWITAHSARLHVVIVFFSRTNSIGIS